MKGEKMMNKKMGMWVLLVFFALSGFGPALASQTKTAKDIERISPEMTHEKVKAGNAVLVCAYGDDKCKDILLEGALLRSEFEARLPALPKDQEIIFYCG